MCPNSFQRTAFLSQRSLDLVYTDRGSNWKNWLKKFTNVNKIIATGYYRNQDEIIGAIVENCNNLTHIQFTYRLMDGYFEKKFFDKFGHKLISLDISYSENLSSTLTKATNIEELTLQWFDSQLSQIKFNRLKKFKVSYLTYEKLDSFVVFIENNTKTLKHLDIFSNNKFDYKRDEKLLKIIMKAEYLVHLSFDLCFVFYEKSITDYWKEIAINCKQIKSLKLCLKVNENMRINKELLSILKQFKRLKRLDLYLLNNNFYKTFDKLSSV